MKISFGAASAALKVRMLQSSIAIFATLYLLGCGSTKPGTKKDDFFTSGSREADQRAAQTMAKNEQLAGTGEGAGEKNVKKAKVAKPGDEDSSATTNKAAQAEGKLALYDRLGAEAGISNIVADFLPRVLNDPRVNWERKGVSRQKFNWFGRNRDNKSVMWSATAQNKATLQKHLVQFIAITTGGPSKYDGKEIKTTHAGMHITNPEFDAVIGDLKASLDKLQIPNKEQKELLAIVESTRPEIVTER
jgi:hemoglobin